MYEVFAFIIFAGVTVLTVAQAPLWTSPSTTSLVLDTRDSQACDNVTLLHAQSGNSQRVEFSLVSQVPDGNFTIGFDDFSNKSVLQCQLASITEAQYTVSIRAHYDDGSEDFTDITLNITVIGSNTTTPENQTKIMATDFCQCSAKSYWDGTNCITKTTICSGSQDTTGYVVVVVILSLVVTALAVYAAYLTLSMKRNAWKLGFARKEKAVEADNQSMIFQNEVYAEDETNVSTPDINTQMNNERRESQKAEIKGIQENKEGIRIKDENIPGNIHTDDSKEDKGHKMANTSTGNEDQEMANTPTGNEGQEEPKEKDEFVNIDINETNEEEEKNKDTKEQ